MLPGLEEGPWATPVIQHQETSIHIKAVNASVSECLNHERSRSWAPDAAAALHPEAPEGPTNQQAAGELLRRAVLTHAAGSHLHSGGQGPQLCAHERHVHFAGGSE